jgi:MtN3 and saliva related transmembrane protein
MSILAFLATVFGTITALAMIPQAYKIFKRKSAKDISLITYSFFGASAFIWFFYGMEIYNVPIIISEAVGAVIVVSIIIGWFLYGR